MYLNPGVSAVKKLEFNKLWYTYIYFYTMDSSFTSQNFTSQKHAKTG